MQGRCKLHFDALSKSFFLVSLLQAQLVWGHRGHHAPGCHSGQPTYDGAYYETTWRKQITKSPHHRWNRLSICSGESPTISCGPDRTEENRYCSFSSSSSSSICS